MTDDEKVIIFRPKYGYSWLHDAAVDLCLESPHPCPFGCGKGGAPNCSVNVSELRCDPARRSIEAARKRHAQMKMAKQAHLETLSKDDLPHLIERRDAVLTALSGYIEYKSEEDKLFTMFEWLEEQIIYLQAR